MTDLQLTLPFHWRRNWWPRCIRSWMRDANAYGSNLTWSAWNNPFYNLKDQLIDEYGIFLGYNIQRIVKQCTRCDASGNFLWWTDSRYERCMCCNGTGIYRTDYHLLERYNLFGDVYHKPIRLAAVQRYGAMGHLIKGKIEHSRIDSGRAWFSLLMLTFLFDQKVFWKEFFRIASNIARFYRDKFNRFLDRLRKAIAENYKYQFHDPFKELPF